MKGHKLSNSIAIEKLNLILNKYSLPERRTYFELKNFVLAQECTIQGQMWQVIRELSVLQENLDSLEMQIEESKDDLELLDIQISETGQKRSKGRFHKEKTVILTRKLDRRKKSLQKSINKLNKKKDYLNEEVVFLVGTFEALNKIEEFKPIDDVESQRKYWDEKLLEELKLDILLKNKLSNTFVRSVLSLDNESEVKKQLVSMLQHMQFLMMEEQKHFLANQNQKQVKNG